MFKFDELYNSSDPSDRRQALQMLQSDPSMRASESLRQLALHDADADIRQLARQALHARGQSVPDVAAPFGDAHSARGRAGLAAFPADTFLLNPANRDYVQGRADKPTAFVVKGKTPLGKNTIIFLIIITVAIMLFTAREWINLIDLTTNGIVIDAVVVDKYVSIRNNEWTTDYYVKYQFSANNAVFESAREVNYQNTYLNVEIGDPIMVVYSPSNPNLSVLPNELNWPALGLVGVAGSLLAAFLTGLSILGYNQQKKQVAVHNEGQPIVGQLSNYKVKKHSNNLYIMTLDYEFTSPTSGQVLKNKRPIGKAINLKDKRAQPDQPTQADPLAVMPDGTPVIVWYLNDKAYEML
jgi:hypothetical protein